MRKGTDCCSKKRCAPQPSCKKPSCCDPCVQRKGSKNKPVRTMKMVLFLPCILLLTGCLGFWSLHDVYKNMVLGNSTVVLWGIICCTLGSYLGKKEATTWCFHKNCCKELISLPRSYGAIIVLVIVLVLKSFWSYFYVTCVQIPVWMYLMDMMTASIATGFFTGQTVTFFKRYLN